MEEIGPRGAYIVRNRRTILASMQNSDHFWQAQALSGDDKTLDPLAQTDAAFVHDPGRRGSGSLVVVERIAFTC